MDHSLFKYIASLSPWKVYHARWWEAGNWYVVCASEAQIVCSGFSGGLLKTALPAELMHSCSLRKWHLPSKPTTLNYKYPTQQKLCSTTQATAHKCVWSRVVVEDGFCVCVCRAGRYLWLRCRVPLQGGTLVNAVVCMSRTVIVNFVLSLAVAIVKVIEKIKFTLKGWPQTLFFSCVCVYTMIHLRTFAQLLYQCVFVFAHLYTIPSGHS